MPTSRCRHSLRMEISPSTHRSFNPSRLSAPRSRPQASNGQMSAFGQRASWRRMYVRSSPSIFSCPSRLVATDAVARGWSIASFDGRNFAIAVAGPAALIVAKVHKIADRAGSRRARPKDALDVLRLLRAIPTTTLRERMELILRDPKSEASTRDGLMHLRELFGRPQSDGSQMAADAAAPLEDREIITASCAARATDLLRSLAV